MTDRTHRFVPRDVGTCGHDYGATYCGEASDHPVHWEGDRPAHVIAPNGWCSTCGAYTCGEGDRG